MKTVYRSFVSGSFRKLLFLLLVTTLTAGRCLAQDYTYVKSVGEYGTGDGQFSSPTGITVDKAGNLYVVDYMNARVQVFNAQGEFVRHMGSPGTNPGQLQWPLVVEISANGQQVYVGQDQAVEIFSLDGQFIKHVNFIGNDATFVNGIAIQPGTGNIFVASAFEIAVYSPDFGAHIKTFGEAGKGNGQFNNIRQIAFDKKGRLLVADLFNNRIQVLDGDGNFITSFGTEGDLDGQFQNPSGLAIDGSGFVYVMDYKHLQIFNVFDGNNGAPTYTFVGKFGSPGLGDYKFRGAYDVALDWNGTVYISDASDNRVKIYNKPSAAAFKSFPDFVKTYGDENFIVGAMTEEGRIATVEQIEDPEFTGKVTLDPYGNNFIVKIARAGAVKLRATVPDNVNQARATAYAVIDIKKAPQEITFNALAARVFGEAPFDLEATTTSGLAATFETSNPLIASITGKVVTLKGAGTATVTARQDGNENYLAAEPKTQPLEITAITGVAYEEHNDVRAYPIPAHDVLTIIASFSNEITPVTICDTYGRTVRQLTPEVIDAQTRRINVADLTPGLYVLKLNDSKNTARRIIKN